MSREFCLKNELPDQQFFVSSEREQEEGEFQQSKHEATENKTLKVRKLESKLQLRKLELEIKVKESQHELECKKANLHTS